MADQYDYPSNSKVLDDAGYVSKPWNTVFSRWQSILSAIVDKGTTAQRPTKNLWIGRIFYDTTLGAPVYLQSYPPAVWVPFGGGGGATPVFVARFFANTFQASNRGLYTNWAATQESTSVSYVSLNGSGSYDFVEAGTYEVTVHGTCQPVTIVNWPEQQTVYGTKLVLVGVPFAGYFDRSQYARSANGYVQSELNANAGGPDTTGDPQQQKWTDTFTFEITSDLLPQNMQIGMYVQNYNTSDFTFWGRVCIKKLPTA